MSEVKADTDQAINFLQQISPDEDWVLTAIEPDTGVIETRTLNPAQARVFIDQYQNKRNLYYSVNSVIGKLNKKSTKEDIRAVRYLHVDIDYQSPDLKAEDERILNLLTDKRPKGVPQPTLIIRSGGGYQALYRLITPIVINGDVKKAEEAERYNRQLESLLGADPCHNADRILRIAGTINIPNKKKIARGRIPQLATIVDNTGPDYELKAFRPADATRVDDTASAVTSEIVRVDNLEDLNKYNVPNATKIAIAQGKGEREREGEDNSRSGWLLWTTMSLVSHGVPDEMILGILTDPGWGVSESVLEKRNVLKYAQRQVSRAKDRVQSDAPFEVDGGGQILFSQVNIKICLHKAGIDLAHDKFADRLMVYGLKENDNLLQDEDVVRMFLMCDEDHEVRGPYDFFQKVIEDLARKNPFHPVLDYLNDLTWDGIPRIDKWLVRYGAAKDTDYVRAVSSLMLIAAVKRVRVPGAKFDEMVIFQSKQGSQKSTALSDLMPNPDWFSDDIPLTADSKLAMEQMAGRWILEAADLKGLKKGDVDHIKALLSRRVDRARMAYGRITKDMPRQCIIVGTVNDDKFLKDVTGNRRFWPVTVGKFKLAALREDRDQLWAEASFREAQGESIRLDPSLYDVAAVEQDERKIEDPYVEILSTVIRGLTNCRVPTHDVWRFVGILDGQMSQELNRRVGQAMKDLGFTKKTVKTTEGNDYYYQSGDGSELVNLKQVGDRWVVKKESDSDETPF